MDAIAELAAYLDALATEARYAAGNVTLDAHEIANFSAVQNASFARLLAIPTDGLPLRYIDYLNNYYPALKEVFLDTTAWVAEVAAANASLASELATNATLAASAYGVRSTVSLRNETVAMAESMELMRSQVSPLPFTLDAYVFLIVTDMSRIFAHMSAGAASADLVTLTLAAEQYATWTVDAVSQSSSQTAIDSLNATATLLSEALTNASAAAEDAQTAADDLQFTYSSVLSLTNGMSESVFFGVDLGIDFPANNQTAADKAVEAAGYKAQAASAAASVAAQLANTVIFFENARIP